MSEHLWTVTKITETITALEKSPEHDLGSAQENWLYLLHAWSVERLDPSDSYSRGLLEALMDSSRESQIKTIIRKVNREKFPDRDEQGYQKALKKVSKSPEELVEIVVAELHKALKFIEERYEEVKKDQELT
jgi:ribosomal protein S20